MTQIAFPFLILSDDAIDAGQWEVIRSDGVSKILGTYLKDWDYQSSITLRRSLNINREIAAANLGVNPAELVSLQALLRIGTGPGAKPRKWMEAIGFRVNQETNRFYVEHEIFSELLSTRLHLTTEIVLNKLFEAPGVLSPSLKGARLWIDEIDVSLEGVEPRFPVETISFGAQFKNRSHAGSTWYLHWNSSKINDEFSATVRLYLNADNEAFIERFTSADELTLQSVMAGVMTQMIGGVLQNELYKSLPECEFGTVGYMVNYWMQVAFPSESISSVVSKFVSRPSEFYACILAAAEIEGN